MTTTTTTRRRGRAIDERTRAVLAAAHIDGTHLRLADQLTPDEYARTRCGCSRAAARRSTPT
jgi:hypothetical protein